MGCGNLLSININPNNVTYRTENKCLIHIPSKTIVYAGVDGTIPTSADVNCIGTNAFSDSMLSELIVPDNIQIISQNAFSGMDQLTSVTIGENVETIGNYAFSYCSLLQTVDFMQTGHLKTLGNGAFYYCESLSAILLPDSLMEIGGGPFSGCHNMRLISIGTNIQTIGGSLIDTENYCTISFRGTLENWLSSDILGETLGNKASLIVDGQEISGHLTLPYGITRIGSHAFRGIRKLTSVSVTSIGNNAFFCSGIISIVIPDSITDIGRSAFNGCEQLTSITIGNGVTEIEDAVLACGDKLESVILGDNIKIIGAYVFNGDFNLRTITLPESITYIGDEAFRATGLTDINYLGTIAQWLAIDKSERLGLNDTIIHCKDGDVPKNN